MLVLDSADKYIVYRFGSPSHIDLEYPKDLSNSFEKFKRLYYTRYGGYPNAGTVISQVEFVNEGYTYKLFEQLFTLKEDERYEIGVTVENNLIGKETRIDGILKTEKGGLLGLKESALIKLSSGPLDIDFLIHI
ncbi:hypothetical protein [Mucilaginibacter lacusdianchii]|uniref:hypothetical protein n=1 Tax=Mucilaginibacter lacusdianchii TaxID=2684211 RepID=UPI00131DA40F|nr:hypothetical protein [Mucilaginibacter sp. JXJ CY 39]